MPKKRRVKLSQSVKNMVASSQQWVCNGCGDLLPSTFQVDHIQPYAVRVALNKDPNERSNLHALCPNCHAAKTQIEQPHIVKFTKFAEQFKHTSEEPCWECRDIVSSHFQNHACKNDKLK